MANTNVSHYGFNIKESNRIEGASYEAYKIKVWTILKSKSLKK
jgi:hypothetical protein